MYGNPSGETQLGLKMLSKKDRKKQEKMEQWMKTRSNQPEYVAPPYAGYQAMMDTLHRHQHHRGCCMHGYGVQYGMQYGLQQQHLQHPQQQQRLIIPAADYDNELKVHSSLIHVYARDGEVEKIKATLAQLPNDERRYYANKPDSNGDSPLHIAARFDHIELMVVLIRNGADLNAQSEEKATPLHYACQSHHVFRSNTVCSGHGANQVCSGNQSKKRLTRYEIYEDGSYKRLTPPGDAAGDGADGGDADKPGDVVGTDGELQPSHSLAVPFLIKAGANYQAVDCSLMTPLHYAAICGNEVALEFLMRCTRVNLMAIDRDRNTPLHYAALFSQVTFCNKLLDAQVDYQVKNSTDTTPIHCSAYGGCQFVLKRMLQMASDRGRDYLRKVLLDTDENGNHVLLLAAEKSEKHTNELIQVIVQYIKVAFSEEDNNDADTENSAPRKIVNLPNKKMEYPIHCAARNNDIEVLNQLWDLGACVDEQDGDLETPLHKAVMFDNIKVIEFLLFRMARMNRQNSSGQTPLMVAIDNEKMPSVHALLKYPDTRLALKDAHGRNAIFIATGMKDDSVLTILLDFLKNRKKPPEGDTLPEVLDATDNDGNTALHRAVMTGHPRIVESLLSENPDCERVNREKQTPLHFAVESGRTAICLLLIRTNPSLLKITDENRNTPLHVAAARGYTQLCRTLLENGADIHEQNFDKLTPLDVAARNNRDDVVRELVNSGGNIDGHDGVYPLLLAARHGNAQVVILLLERGADIKITDAKGNNCLDIAIDHAINSEKEDTLYVILRSVYWQEALKSITFRDYEKDHAVRPILLENLDTPMRKLIRHIPEVAYEVLNMCALKMNPVNYSHPDLQMELNFTFIDDYIELVKFIQKTEKYEKRAYAHYSNPDIPKWTMSKAYVPIAALKRAQSYEENHPLRIMVDNGRLTLVEHPVCQTLLARKWNNVTWISCIISAVIYLFFLAMLTAYASTVLPAYTVFNKTLVTQGNTSYTREMAHDCEEFNRLVPRNYFVPPAAIILMTIAVLNTLCMIVTVIHTKLCHWNWVEWLVEIAVYVLTFIYVFNMDDCQQMAGYRYDWQLACGAVAIFLAWMHTIEYLKMFPLFGLKLIMFREIAVTFLWFIPVFALIVIAFAIGLYCLLQNYDNFSLFGFSFVKTIDMMMGELDFADTFFPETEEGSIPDGVAYIIPTVFFFFFFMCAMNVVLINMLTGLAIEDIKDTVANATITMKKLRVTMALRTEKLPMAYFVTSLQGFFRSPDNIFKPNKRAIFSRLPKGQEFQKAKEEGFEEHTEEGERTNAARRQLHYLKGKIDEVVKKVGEYIEKTYNEEPLEVVRRQKAKQS